MRQQLCKVSLSVN